MKYKIVQKDIEEPVGIILEKEYDTIEEAEKFLKNLYFKYKHQALTRQRVIEQGKKFIYAYGYPDKRVLLLDWEEYKKEMGYD